jgi:hypothetical protein
MAEPNPTQQMFDLWRRGLEEGADAWAKMLGQTPAAPADPAALWRPVVQQWVQSWARVFAQTPVTPDVSTQWKQFLDQSIEAWSRALGQAMNTDAFAKTLGSYLDQWLTATSPLKKAADQATDQALQVLGIASRAQLTAVAKQIVELEERVERIEDGVNLVLRRLDSLARTTGQGRSVTESDAPSRERA